MQNNISDINYEEFAKGASFRDIFPQKATLEMALEWETEEGKKNSRQVEGNTPRPGSEETQNMKEQGMK